MTARGRMRGEHLAPAAKRGTAPVELGLGIPNLGRNASWSTVEELSQRAESYGFAAVWVADHVALPAEQTGEDQFARKLDLDPGEPILDPLTVLAYVAAQTTHIRLGAGILTPLRNPISTAKALVTLDVLSRGRLIYGSGAESLRGEFEALNAPFEERGAVTDEYIHIFKELCISEGPVSFAGDHYAYEHITFSPPPTQRPHPPVWIGGNSDAAMRRAVRLGDGWQPMRLPPDELSVKVANIREWLHDAGGEPEDLTISVRLDSALGADPKDHWGTGIAGSPEEMLDGIAAYTAAGASHIVLTPRDKDPQALAEHVDRLGAEVLPGLER